RAARAPARGSRAGAGDTRGARGAHRPRPGRARRGVCGDRAARARARGRAAGRAAHRRIARGERAGAPGVVAALGRAHAGGERGAGALAEAQARVQALRTAQLGCEERLEGARGAREAARGELTSLEALQAAALSDHAGQAAEWLRGAALAARPRLAADLEVEPGWERAVETALGDYLEAVGV